MQFPLNHGLHQSCLWELDIEIQLMTSCPRVLAIQRKSLPIRTLFNLIIELEEILIFPTFHHAQDLQNILPLDKDDA